MLMSFISLRRVSHAKRGAEQIWRVDSTIAINDGCQSEAGSGIDHMQNTRSCTTDARPQRDREMKRARSGFVLDRFELHCVGKGEDYFSAGLGRPEDERGYARRKIAELLYSRD
jgi:hypothetical protein